MNTDFPTPPASSMASPLPKPRRYPLQPGGMKESELIRYLDHGVNQIQKRVDNRVTNRKKPALLGQEDGYRVFWEVAKDLDGLVDVVWVSGSRTYHLCVFLSAMADPRYLCSEFANSIPPQPCCAHCGLSATISQYHSLYASHLSASIEARLRILIPSHGPRLFEWRDFTRLRGGPFGGHDR